MDDKSQPDADDRLLHADDDLRRFAVLCHTDSAGKHFDLLIENGDTLATWNLDQPPETAGVDGMRCWRIQDHRRVYLEYEGPISGNRGHVSRRDEGTSIVHACEPSCWNVTFRGTHLIGRFVIHQSAADTALWLLARR